jgi:stage II sporulation protein AA (anti-sigma F factor antagonist)
VTVPSLSFHVDRHDGGTRIAVGGDIDMATAAQLVSRAHASIDESPALLTLDFTKVTILDSSGVKALITIHQYASARGCDLIVSKPQPVVKQVLDIARIGEFITVEVHEN